MYAPLLFVTAVPREPEPVTVTPESGALFRVTVPEIENVWSVPVKFAVSFDDEMVPEILTGANTYPGREGVSVKLVPGARLLKQ